MNRDHDVRLAAELLAKYGGSSNDYFKLWHDKQYWFTGDQDGFVAYGVSHRVAVSLGDPVTAPDKMNEAIQGFQQFCRKQRYTPLFYQTASTYLPLYQQLGFRDFKGSEEAIVDLTVFTTSGHQHKPLRNAMNRLTREGLTTRVYDSPIPDEIIDQARTVSVSWLNSGRRERTFSVGRFEDEYVRYSPMMAVFDADEEMLAFANIIPSYAPETATVDMMRHRSDIPHGVMDFLFLKLFDHNRAEGYRYFSLGPAPIIKPPPDEEIDLEERAFYQLANYLDSFFSMRGLRVFKEKFATHWEPLYLIYRKRIDIPRFILAINSLSELDENKKPLLSRTRMQQIQQTSLATLQDLRKARKDRRNTRHMTVKDESLPNSRSTNS
jgi:phosphatidylglycerol lysyltransferase